MVEKFLPENYDCNEYVSQYEDGYYDEDSYLQLILPVAESSIHPDQKHLTIGYAGADGIEFCFRPNMRGIWAYYPIDDGYEQVAVSLAQLIDGWCNGSIQV